MNKIAAIIFVLCVPLGLPSQAASSAQVQHVNNNDHITFSPQVDYHQHLASPAGIALLNRSLPSIAVPPEVAGLIGRMEHHWNDPKSLQPLYTRDAVVLSNYNDPQRGWLQGDEKAARYIGTLHPRAYRLIPVMYSAKEQSARVAGYLARGEGDDAKNFGYFYFDLEKSGSDQWRIAADNRTFLPGPEYLQEITGEQLLAMLDRAGIRQAVLMSDAYWFDSPNYILPSDDMAKVYNSVREENDWTAEQAMRSQGRLVAFCSFNPLASHALAELKRCSASNKFMGVKLHLQTSGVDLQKQAHVDKLREIFSVANRLRLPIAVHAQTKDNYGREAVQTLLSKVLVVAPDVPVTIAHLWGGGPFASEALTTFAEAVAQGAPGTKNLYFDVAEAALVAEGSPETQQAIAEAIRTIGLSRILFGSDAVGSSTLPPEKAAAQFRADIPLTAEEFSVIASNVMPYLAGE